MAVCAALAAAMLSGCTTGEVRYAAPAIAGHPLSERQQRLVRSAHDLIGVDRLYVGGTEYRDDCTGAVLAVYAAAGINLGAHFHRYQGNGVARLHRMMRDHRNGTISWPATWYAASAAPTCCQLDRHGGPAHHGAHVAYDPSTGRRRVRRRVPAVRRRGPARGFSRLGAGGN